MGGDEEDSGDKKPRARTSQTKILLDSNGYFRLAQSLHPLLFQAFGTDRYCLYVLPELDREYARQPRLQLKFPWADDPEYRENRQSNPHLSRQQRQAIENAFDILWDHVQTVLPGPSRVDVTVLSYGYVLSIPVVTDDADMAELGKTFGIPLMTTLELLRLMLDCGHVSLEKIRQIVATGAISGTSPEACRMSFHGCSAKTRRNIGDDEPVNRIFRQGGPHRIRHLGGDQHSMRVSLPGDVEGRTARECPNEACSPGYFKVKGGTGITDGQENAFCPYCRRKGEPSDFHTKEQICYAKDIVEREARRASRTCLGVPSVSAAPESARSAGACSPWR